MDQKEEMKRYIVNIAATINCLEGKYSKLEEQVAILQKNIEELNKKTSNNSL